MTDDGACNTLIAKVYVTKYAAIHFKVRGKPERALALVIMVILTHGPESLPMQFTSMLKTLTKHFDILKTCRHM